MNTPIDSPGGRPLLAPLGRPAGWKNRIREALGRLPPAAAPIAFTLAGGVALVAVVASLLAVDPARNAAGVQAPPAVEATTAGAPAAAGEAAGIAVNDEETATTPAPAAEEQASAMAPAAVPTPVTAADLAALKIPTTDPAPPLFDAVAPGERTASIPPALPGGAFVPVVEVAETPEELEALEAIQREEVAEDVGEPSPEETAAIPPAAGPRVSATTTKWVNMRAGPSDDAEVLEVVPALATVDAEAGCDWCAVSFEGREGYIYKTFLSYDEAGGEGAPAE